MVHQGNGVYSYEFTKVLPQGVTLSAIAYAAETNGWAYLTKDDKTFTGSAISGCQGTTTDLTVGLFLTVSCGGLGDVSMRYVTFVKAPYTGTYTFYLNYHECAKLSINNEELYSWN